jgi:apolipoprotein N-acyltransferase
MHTRKYLPVVWFVLGFGLFMSTRASHFIPHWGPAIIIAPVFILAFGRSLSSKRGILLTVAGFVVSLNVAMWRLYDVGDPVATIALNVLRSSIQGALVSLPYIVDRLVYPRLERHKVLSTLSFPIAATAVHFLMSLEGPFDGDMVSGVYGMGGLAFKQIASIVGLWGFVFVFSWFASVVNLAWEQGFAWRRIRYATLSLALTVAGVFLFGALKIAPAAHAERDSVRVAAVFLLPDAGAEVDQVGLLSRALSPLEETITRIDALTEEAASDGAKIVAFQEATLKIHETDEETVVERLSATAAEHGVYLGLGYGVIPEQGKGWNKAILISDRGTLELQYRKRYLLGLGDLFGESIIYRKGPAVIQSVATPYGRIAVSVCRDMSFSPYARQAGAQHVDIMLSPSYDMPKSGGPVYALRAIENGFSMIRPVYNGYSYAVDYNGRLLAGMDSDDTGTGIMYADVPTKGVTTIYAQIGDLLGWLCVAGLLGSVVLHVVSSVRRRKTASSAGGGRDPLS